MRSVVLFQFAVIYLALALSKQVENTLAILLPLQLLLIDKDHYILSQLLPELLQRYPYFNKLGLLKILRKKLI